MGAGHPLVVLLRRSEVAFQQLVWVTAVEAAGFVHFAGGWAFGLSLAIAAVVVQVGLGCRLAVLSAARRDVCLELIVEGHGALPLACIEHLRRCLLERRVREGSRAQSTRWWRPPHTRGRGRLLHWQRHA